MSSRESFSQSPAGRVVIAGVVLLLVVGAIYMLKPAHAGAHGTRAFFTVDDGRTWFVDDAAKLPPFDKDGKPAVRANVYRCADGTKFVNDMERYKPDAKLLLENAASPAAKTAGNVVAYQNAYHSGREVKRPGEQQWVQADDARAAASVTAVKCPNGSTTAEPVEP